MSSNGIYFYTGSMNSSKTSLLVTAAYNYRERGLTPLVIKPKIDNREDDPTVIVSRSGGECKGCYPLLPDTESGIDTEQFNELVEMHFDAMIIDEVQFLSLAQIKQLFLLARKRNAPLICYGLRNSFVGGGFPASDWLMQNAKHITLLKSICHCGSTATHNLMVRDGQAYYGEGSGLIEDPIFVGGNETYHAVCFEHFRKGEF